jgi:hypothetical protein
MDWPGFVGPSSLSQSPLADCERCVNWYFEPNDSRSGRPALYPTPGAVPFITGSGINTIGTRALAEMNGRAFGVIGEQAYELFAGQYASPLGAVARDANPAQIAFSGLTASEALFASGGNAYWMNLVSNVFTAAPVLTGEATQIGMIDGFGLAFNTRLGKLRISNHDDFSTWDPTQFAVRSNAPDNWRAMLVNAPDIWLLGEQSGDVWYNAGNTPFPFAPRPGASFAYGIAATFSTAAAGDSVFWLSQNAQGAGVVVRARGYVPQPINSYALDFAMARYQRESIISDAEAITFQRSGHTFYVLRLPTANATWMYDLRTGSWTELGYWNSPENRYDAWHPRCVCYAFGKHLVGENATGVISALDDTVGVEADGAAIRRLRVPAAISAAEDGRIYADRFELEIEHGLGTQTGQGADPVAMLRWSKTYGRTWGNERWQGLGRIGEYDKRTYWLKCGSSDLSLVPEIVISDPIPARIVGAYAQLRGARAKVPSAAA